MLSQETETRHWHARNPLNQQWVCVIWVVEPNGLQPHFSRCSMPDQQAACALNRHDVPTELPPPIVVPFDELTGLLD